MKRAGSSYPACDKPGMAAHLGCHSVGCRSVRRRSVAAVVALALPMAVGGCPADATPPAPVHSATTRPRAEQSDGSLTDAAARAIDPRQILERVVKRRCVGSTEPWALLHGLMVYGLELRLPSGELAVDQLARDNLRRDATGKLVFTPAEPQAHVPLHPGLFLKVLLEAGVSPKRALPTADGGTVTLGEVVRDALGRYQSSEGLHGEAWLLETLAAGGKPPAVAAARRHALDVVEREQRPFVPFLSDPTRPYEKPWRMEGGKRRAVGIHSYYCGGMHLVQAVGRLHSGQLVSDRLRQQYAIVLVRIDKETEYWDGKLAEARARTTGQAQRGHQRVILGQQLKLLGHGLETYLRAVGDGLLALDPPTRRRLGADLLELGAVLRAIESAGIYRDLDALKQSQQQLFLDYVGDSAHALHAYRLAAAAGIR